MGRDCKELALLAVLIAVTCVQASFAVRTFLEIWNRLTAS